MEAKGIWRTNVPPRLQIIKVLREPEKETREERKVTATVMGRKPESALIVRKSDTLPKIAGPQEAAEERVAVKA